MNPLEYQHGGSALKAFEKYNLKPRKTIDFSVNVNPLGPPPALSKAWPKQLTHLAQYPSSEGQKITTFYQQRFGLEAANILPLNGSIEAIYFLPKFLKLAKVLLPEPAFFDYRAALELSGASVISLPTFLGAGLDLKSVKNSLHKVDGLMLGNPQNPTGGEVDSVGLINLVKDFPGVQFLIDIAFFQFLPDPEKVNLMPFVSLLPNLWLFHSLTKIYAIPALRVGALLGPAEQLTQIKSKLPPWRINGIVENLIGELGEIQKYEQETRDLIAREQKRIRKALEQQTKITLYPSKTNFILAEFKGEFDLDQFFIQALQAGLHFRDARNFNWLKGNFFRFAILKPKQNDQLISFLTQI